MFLAFQRGIERTTLMLDDCMSLRVMLGFVDCCIFSDAVAVKHGDIYCYHLRRALLGLMKRTGQQRRRHK